jgi:hypothetical protein
MIKKIIFLPLFLVVGHLPALHETYYVYESPFNGGYCVGQGPRLSSERCFFGDKEQVKQDVFEQADVLSSKPNLALLKASIASEAPSWECFGHSTLVNYYTHIKDLYTSSESLSDWFSKVGDFYKENDVCVNNYLLSPEMMMTTICTGMAFYCLYIVYDDCKRFRQYKASYQESLEDFITEEENGSNKDDECTQE